MSATEYAVDDDVTVTVPDGDTYAATIIGYSLSGQHYIVRAHDNGTAHLADDEHLTRPEKETR